MEFIASDKLLFDFDIDKAVDRLKARMDDRGIRKITLAGHSLGGAVAMKFAHKYPETVEKLFLLNAEGIKAEKIGFDAFMKMISENIRKPGQTLFRKLKEGAGVLKNPIFQYKLGFYAHNLDLSGVAGKVSVPTVLIWGDKDRLIPFVKGERLHSLIKNSKLIRLEGMDHDWIMHSPDLFWKEFLL